jgi:isopentenyl diphosphate isomerase/L-lactate dehydrogenase-like FMN-dependent dehydrogenase
MYRRAFLQFLAASPLLARAQFSPLVPQDKLPLITSAADALNVFEFEDVARSKVQPAHFGYLASGADDDATLIANRVAFTHYQLRARRLVDIAEVDIGTSLLGTRISSPLLLQPAGRQRRFHPEGELVVARAAKSRGVIQTLSNQFSYGIEDVAAAREAPVIFQLYANDDWNRTVELLRRAEKAGSKVMMWTVDGIPGRNLESFLRFRRLDTADCKACHAEDPSLLSRRPYDPPRLTWDYLKRLKDATSMKVVVKGIDTREDAALCLRYGADGIVVSNHGGRTLDSGRGTLDALPEVVAAVGGRIPIIVDGGIRRGTDIFKALALGATAVGIGRPYLWGLGAFGQEGVEAVIDILHRELRLVMRQCGCRSIAEITPAHIMRGEGTPFIR